MQPASRGPQTFRRTAAEEIYGATIDDLWLAHLTQLEKSGSGPRDFNYTQTKAIAERMRRDGFSGVAFFELPEADHLTWLPAEWWARALDHLDGR